MDNFTKYNSPNRFQQTKFEQINFLEEKKKIKRLNRPTTNKTNKAAGLNYFIQKLDFQKRQSQ